jgi:hypothetical protein
MAAENTSGNFSTGGDVNGDKKQVLKKLFIQCG